MAKAKNKKSISSDQVYKKREAINNAKKQMNPFEVHVNKEKIRVLGRKLKNDRGLPGISRAKAINKRKHTLLQEYKSQNKSNKFMDKRIGEKNHSMTGEDKIMARFAAVRAKSHNRKSIFNLADDEILTHKGQTLSEIENFDDPRSEDEASDDERHTGNLGRDFVGDAHFGGGILKKTGKEGAKTHKELIEQLIEESKKRKMEKQKTKEATLELTEKLDTEWKDLMPLINTKKKAEPVVVEQEKSQVDDYDKVMRELKFEARGTVSDRLKTEDEIAVEQKEKLEELEKERVERMRGFSDDKPPKQNHRSADDLDDNFVYDSEPDEEYTLSYNAKGESNVKLDLNVDNTNLSDQEENNENNQDQGEEESEQELETDSEDNMSDLKEESSEYEAEEEEKTEEIEVKQPKKRNLDTQIDISTKKTKVETAENLDADTTLQQAIKEDLLKRKQIMEQAGKELPFTFSLPDSYEALVKLFDSYPNNHQSLIIERMIKCNHPSLSEGNKEGLGVLFAYLLQYVNDIFSEVENERSLKNSFDLLKTLVPKIYELAQLNPENAHNSVLEVIKEKQAEFRKRKKEYLGLEVLVFLKLVSLLFPTSDFRHQIVTPCLVFIEQMLTKCRVKSKRDISYGLFLVTIVLEYTTLSKRYMPAALNFLSGIIHMAIPKLSVKLIKVIPPFKPIASNLVLTKACDTKNLKMNAGDLLSSETKEDYKVRTFYFTLLLLKEFFGYFKELPSNVQIFEDVENYLKQVPLKLYPKIVQEECRSVLECFEKQRVSKKLYHIVMEARKPKALRLYEPKIVEVYDFKRQRKGLSKEKAEKEKLLHKLKKETKGALREIRKDKAFLGRIKINQKIQSDKERKEKVTRIFAEASMQQGELKSLDRMKKKKK